MWIKKILNNWRKDIIDALFTEKFKAKIIDDLIEHVDLPAFEPATEKQIYTDLIEVFEKRLKK